METSKKKSFFDSFRNKIPESARKLQKLKISDSSQNSQILKSKDFRHAQKSKISDKRSLYIIVAVILVAGLILSFSGLTGKSMWTFGKCIDSDNGDYPESPGIVSYENSKVSYKDECYAWGNVGIKKYVKERYCIGKMKTREYHCFNGCLEDNNGIGYCKPGGYDIVNN